MLTTNTPAFIEGTKYSKGKKMPTKKHPGFKAVQKKIAKKQGIGMEAAGAILANASRNASAAAKRKNPSLKKVKGKAK